MDILIYWISDYELFNEMTCLQAHTHKLEQFSKLQLADCFCEII